MIKQYTKGKAVKLSANFKSTEFDCHGEGCCNSTAIDTELVDILQKIRSRFGKAVKINSGYRCKTHNKSVGGALKSNHLTGTAADIAVSGISPTEVAAFAESIGVMGIGLYTWGCHIDTRNEKAFWYSDKQEYRSTFGGAPTVNLPILKNGSKGDAVKTLQVLLNAKGYKGKNGKTLTVDGIFGANCDYAVENFRKDVKLTAAKIVDGDMWKKVLGV